MWQFAIYSGLRHGEIAALAWEDVDLQKDTVHVRRNLTVLKMFGPPKTRAGDRTVKRLKPALEALKAQRMVTELQPRTTIIFITESMARQKSRRCASSLSRGQ